MAKHHLASPTNPTRTLCDMPIEAVEWHDGRLPIAEGVEDLLAMKRRHRCAKCIAVVARAVVAEPEPTEEPFEPSSRPLRPDDYASRMRSRTLSRASQRAIDRSVRGEASERTWSSAEAALRAWLTSAPSSMRSSSDFGVRVQSSRDPSLGGAAHATIDRHRTTSLACQRAFERLLFEPALLEALVPWATTERPSHERHAWPTPAAIVSVAEHARSIAFDRVLGRANNEQLADDETRDSPQARVTARQIQRVVRHFVGAVHDALIASGEMAMPRTTGVEGGTRDGRSDRSRWDPLRRLREKRARTD